MDDQTAEQPVCGETLLRCFEHTPGGCDPVTFCEHADIRGTVGVACPSGTEYIQIGTDDPVDVPSLPTTANYSGGPYKPGCNDSSWPDLTMEVQDSNNDKIGSVTTEFQCTRCP